MGGAAAAFSWRGAAARGRDFFLRLQLARPFAGAEICRGRKRHRALRSGRVVARIGDARWPGFADRGLRSRRRFPRRLRTGLSDGRGHLRTLHRLGAPHFSVGAVRALRRAVAALARAAEYGAGGFVADRHSVAGCGGSGAVHVSRLAQCRRTRRPRSGSARWLPLVGCELAAFVAVPRGVCGADRRYVDLHCGQSLQCHARSAARRFRARRGRRVRHLPLRAAEPFEPRDHHLRSFLGFITLVGRMVFEGTHEPIGSFLLMAIVVIGTFGAAAWWLRRTAGELRASEPQ